MTAQEKIDKIVNPINIDGKSASEVARLLGLSRERISQIYYDAIGARERGRLTVKRQMAREEKRLGRLEQVKYNCAKCQKAVTYKEGKYRHSLCNNCATIKRDQRDQRTTLECSYCHTPYHPYRTQSKSRKFGTFCSQAHYLAYRADEKNN